MSEIRDLRSLKEQQRIARLKLDIVEDHLELAVSDTLSMNTLKHEVVKSVASKKPVFASMLQGLFTGNIKQAALTLLGGILQKTQVVADQD